MKIHLGKIIKYYGKILEASRQELLDCFNQRENKVASNTYIIQYLGLCCPQMSKVSLHNHYSNSTGYIYIQIHNYPKTVVLKQRDGASANFKAGLKIT